MRDVSTFFAAGSGTIAAALRPQQGTWRSHPAMLAIVGVLIISIAAQVSIPIGTVPFTMQTVAVLTLGMAYGWRLGGTTLLLYLLAGGVGLPVFAGGAGGPAALVGFSAGYLWGFVAAAALVGWLAERGWDRSFGLALAAMVLGSVALFAPGIAWLAWLVQYRGPDWALEQGLVETLAAGGGHALTGKGLEWALYEGLWKFRYSESAKLVLAAATLPACWKLIGRHSEQQERPPQS